MKYSRIKKVITTKGQTLYMIGDGCSFVRISKQKALDGIASKKYYLFKTEDKRPKPNVKIEICVAWGSLHKTICGEINA